MNTVNLFCRRGFLGLVITIFGTSVAQCDPPTTDSNGEIQLLVRADDMGFAHAVNEAMIKCYEDGIVRSIEVMVPCPWFEEAVVLLNKHPGIDVGVHLTVTSEWDTCRWRPLTQGKSLVDSTGNFPQSTWHKYMPTRSSVEKTKPTVEDMEKELRAQLEIATTRIKNVTHITCHMGGALYRDDLKKMVQRLAKEYGLAMTAAASYMHVEHTREATSEQRIDAFVKALSELKPGISMYVEHPGLDVAELRAMFHPGYEDVAKDRQAVTDVMTSPKVKAEIARRKIKLISYRDLP